MLEKAEKDRIKKEKEEEKEAEKRRKEEEKRKKEEEREADKKRKEDEKRRKEEEKEAEKKRKEEEKRRKEEEKEAEKKKKEEDERKKKERLSQGMLALYVMLFYNFNVPHRSQQSLRTSSLRRRRHQLKLTVRLTQPMLSVSLSHLFRYVLFVLVDCTLVMEINSLKPIDTHRSKTICDWLQHFARISTRLVVHI